MYRPLKTGASYTYSPTEVFLSLRASKSELEARSILGGVVRSKLLGINICDLQEVVPSKH